MMKEQKGTLEKETLADATSTWLKSDKVKDCNKTCWKGSVIGKTAIKLESITTMVT